jgi:hypothetical protein
MNRAGVLAALALLSCDPPPPPPPAPPPARPGAADVFSDPARPYAERVEALRALREARDPGAYARLRDALWKEAAHADSLSATDLEERAFAEALAWHAQEKDETARVKIELYLDREFVRRKRFRDSTLGLLALALANFPRSASAGETLWAALRDRAESPAVRSACLKALEAFHPKDLAERLLERPAEPGDDWMKDLQERMRGP